MKKSGLLYFHQKIGKEAFLNEFKVEEGLKPGNLDITIRRFFTNVDGTIVAKGAVPANLQVSYPYWLFGKFDFDGGYKYGLQSTPVRGGSQYLYTFQVARSISFLQAFSGFNNVKEELQPGDVVHLFTDDTTNPNFFIWIVVAIPGQSYASILNNLGSGKYLTKNVKFQVDAGQEAQFSEAITLAFVNPLSNPMYNQLMPNTYRTPWQFQTAGVPAAQADMPVKMQLSPYLGWYSYMLFGNDLITFQFETTFKLLYISDNGKS